MRDHQERDKQMGAETGNEEKEYLWEHFKFNAEQRLKAFNFFVVFSVFADGGVFAALERQANGVVFLLIGGFVCLLAVTFFLIDRRSQDLLRLDVPGLKEYEKRFPERSRLFAREEARGVKFVRYTFAFGILFAAQAIFGFGVMLYGVTLLC
jgi:hypothetical protein